MKTLSLALSQKIAALGVEVESDWYWHTDEKGGIEPKLILGRGYSGETCAHNGKNYPAYTLHELLLVLKALSERNGWAYEADAKNHWMEICSLYAQSGELGEGSEVEKYIEGLL